MKVQFKDTPKGEVAILPRAEYERLKLIEQEAHEDAGTARLVKDAKRAIADGAALLPLSVLDAIADGENPVRVLRQFRDHTQQELAVSIGITQNYLSEIETGKRKGPFELHRKIAASLGVPVDLLAPVAVSDQASAPIRSANNTKAIAATPKRRSRR